MFANGGFQSLLMTRPAMSTGRAAARVSWFRRLDHGVEQGLRASEIGRRESLGKPRIDGGQHLPRLGRASVEMMEPREAGCAGQLPPECAMAPRPVERLQVTLLSGGSRAVMQGLQLSMPVSELT